MYYGNSLIGLAILVLDIVALVDIYKSSMDGTKKIIWALVVLLFPVAGMILYFIFAKKVL